MSNDVQAPPERPALPVVEPGEGSENAATGDAGAGARAWHSVRWTSTERHAAQRGPAGAADLTPRQTVARSLLLLTAAVLLGVVVYVVGISQLQHAVSQQGLRADFREQLSEGTAPVSEGTFDDILLQNGAPVAVLQIPQLGIDEVVVEGTSSGDLAKGPGHRRDTVLPGQQGVSVMMGRAAAFGGPFGRIQELAPGDEFTVITGQGVHTYEVIGVRYAGDLAPAPLQLGEGRLILESARGAAYMPSGVVRVDAELTSEVLPAGTRVTTLATLPVQEKEMASDSRTLWALIFALQFLVVAEFAAVWCHHRFGARRTWVVFVPVLVLGCVLVAEQFIRTLPNLM